jgi:hypothetical protein
MDGVRGNSKRSGNLRDAQAFVKGRNNLLGFIVSIPHSLRIRNGTFSCRYTHKKFTYSQRVLLRRIKEFILSLISSESKCWKVKVKPLPT